jgi:hypothetical protein
VKEQPLRSWRFRAMVMASIAIFLVWEVSTRSVVAYLADVAPEAALTLRSTDPTALLKLADRSIRHKQTASTTEPSNEPARDTEADRLAGEQTRTWVELALLNDPLNAHAFGILAELAQSASDEERTEKLMQAAVRRSLRESTAVYWLMRHSYEKRDFAASVRYADTLLRTRPQVIAHAMPVLSRIAENKEASGELKKLLAGNPPWRLQFLTYLPQSISDARTPLDLLLSLRDTVTPPTAADLQGYLTFLIGHKFHELAYYTWLQFLPPEQLTKVGLLFNGDFEITPSGLPFDWVITPGADVTVDIAAIPEADAGRALFVEFGHGRVDFRGVKQLLMLSPGTYQFQGKYRGDIIGRRGLQWRIVCAGGATPIGEGLMVTGAAPTWKDFEFTFTVPGAGSDCRAQYVRLDLDARSASEQFVSGSIWYDELRITRGE